LWMGWFRFLSMKLFQVCEGIRLIWSRLWGKTFLRVQLGGWGLQPLGCDGGSAFEWLCDAICFRSLFLGSWLSCGSLGTLVPRRGWATATFIWR
jgi:hypothetical protein